MSHRGPDAGHHTRRAAPFGWIVMTSLGVLQACGGGGTDSEHAAIPRDTFIATYVELREADLTLAPERVDSARTAVLAKHHLTDQDLLTFAEVHGRDVTYMKDVWDTIEKRLDAIRTDSVAGH